jgi:signal transduction histidine kinase
MRIAIFETMGDAVRGNLDALLGEDAYGEREDELLTKLVHDLKNPLGIIASFAEEVPVVEEGERQEFCQRLVVNARRALRVLDDFGLVSDLRRGRVRLTHGPCDWSSLVQQGIGEVAEIARESEQELIFQADGELPMVGDAPLLCSALGSLFRETLAGIGKLRCVQARIRDEGEQACLWISVPDRQDGFPERSPFGRDAIGLELARRVFELHQGSMVLRKTLAGASALIRVPRLPGACEGNA